MTKDGMRIGAVPYRVRGALAQIETPIEDAGKWVVDIQLWSVDASENYGSIGLFGPYDTEEIAGKKCTEIALEVADMVAMRVTGQRTGMYFDMKDGGKLVQKKERMQ